jgi:hypothetical protein
VKQEKNIVLALLIVHRREDMFIGSRLTPVARVVAGSILSQRFTLLLGELWYLMSTVSSGTGLLPSVVKRLGVAFLTVSRPAANRVCLL